MRNWKSLQRAKCWRSRLTTAAAAVLAGLLGASAIAAGEAVPLFQTPLHLTREISDPITHTTSLVDEYCIANRVVSIARGGARISIADYARGDLTEIDRAAGTWSLTPFESIAGAYAASSSRPTSHASALGARPSMTEAPPRIIAGRGADIFEGTFDGDAAHSKVIVAFDREITLSRAAVEVLTGAAYPGTPNSGSNAVFAAAAARQPVSASSTSRSSDRIALPLEQVTVLLYGSQRLELTNRVVRVGSEVAPPDLITIPAGSRLVQSKLAKGQRALREVDSLNPSAPSP